VFTPVVHGPWFREISPGGGRHVVGFDGRNGLPLPTLVAGKGLQREVSDIFSSTPRDWVVCGYRGDSGKYLSARTDGRLREQGEELARLETYAFDTDLHGRTA